MMRVCRALPLVLIGMLLCSTAARAQEQVVFNLQPDSKLWVEGTSSKSDFTINAVEFTSDITMKKDVPVEAPGLEQVTVTVPTLKLTGGRSTIMDRLMQEALKAEEHPEIVYELTAADIDGADTSANTFSVQTQGSLTLAGTTKEIEMTVNGEKLSDGKVRFKGSHTLLMSDYGISPPSALFGTLRTGDEVTIKFDLIVAP